MNSRGDLSNTKKKQLSQHNYWVLGMVCISFLLSWSLYRFWNRGRRIIVEFLLQPFAFNSCCKGILCLIQLYNIWDSAYVLKWLKKIYNYYIDIAFTQQKINHFTVTIGLDPSIYGNERADGLSRTTWTGHIHLSHSRKREKGSAKLKEKRNQ